MPEKFTIKLTGFIDRIDKTGETLRIVDYKTGKTDKKELIISEWSDLISDSTLSKSFQLMLYSFMFSKNFLQDIQNIEAGIISFRNLSQGFMKVNIPDNNFSKETFDKFEELLKQLFANIFNENMPFTQTENTGNCKYCAFTSLCNR